MGQGKKNRSRAAILQLTAVVKVRGIVASTRVRNTEGGGEWMEVACVVKGKPVGLAGKLGVWMREGR